MFSFIKIETDEKSKINDFLFYLRISFLKLVDKLKWPSISDLNSSWHLLNWNCKPVWSFTPGCDVILTVCRRWTQHLAFVCLVQSSTSGRSLLWPEWMCGSHVLLQYKHTLQKQMAQASRLPVKYTHSIWICWLRGGMCLLLQTTRWRSAQTHTSNSFDKINSDLLFRFY